MIDLRMNRSRSYSTISTIAALTIGLACGCDRRGDRSWEQTSINVSREQMRVLGEAIAKYQKVHGEFPKGLDLQSSLGTSELSWRVHLLPFLGEDGKELFERFRLDEAWDSAHNLKLLDRKPGYYESPVKGGDDSKTTCFLALVRRSSSRVSSTDSNDMETVFIIEVDRGQAVPWTKPVDLSLTSGTSELRIHGRHQSKYFVLLRDGSIELRTGIAH